LTKLDSSFRRRDRSLQSLARIVRNSADPGNGARSSPSHTAPGVFTGPRATRGLGRRARGRASGILHQVICPGALRLRHQAGATSHEPHVADLDPAGLSGREGPAAAPQSGLSASAARRPYNIRTPSSVYNCRWRTRRTSTPARKFRALGTPGLERMALEQDQRIADVVTREQSRLRNFIRRRVPDPRDVEDILQDVFYELVEANRLLMPIEHVAGWLFRVARNRITDLFRKKKPESFSDAAVADEDGERLLLEDLLPSPNAGPEALYARHVLLEELESAVDELPEEQREVFVAHELEGRSFKEMAAETGVGVNTLLSRKRYAVRHLRERLQSTYDELTNA
jgi:RNA polymerase sigma factor (sigma-70 family)